MPDIARPAFRRFARIGVPPLPDDDVPVAPVPSVTKPAPIGRSSRIGVPKLPDDEPVSEPARPPVQAAIVSPRDASIARAVAIPPRPVLRLPVYGPFVLEGALPF